MVYWILIIFSLRSPVSGQGTQESIAPSRETPSAKSQEDRVPKADCTDLWECFQLSPSIALAESIVNADGQTYPVDYRGVFIKEVAPAALLSAQKNNLFPSIVIAQAILESGWGRSNLARRANNLFGIKTSSGGYKTTTYENENGRRIPSRSRFMIFDNWHNSISYHGVLMGKRKSYVSAFENSETWLQCIRKIAPKYASDPHYAKNISLLIRKYRLDRWDERIRSYSM